MKKETLNSVGVHASADIPAGELFSPTINHRRYGLRKEDMGRLALLRDFVSEYNRELPLDPEAEPVTDSKEAAALLRPVLRGLDHEEVWAVFLDNAGRPLAKKSICKGSLDCTVIDNRKIVKEALGYNASGVILYHNHPSGDPLPSAADIRQTESLRNCLKVFGIQLTDHIVIADSAYFSFADESKGRYA